MNDRAGLARPEEAPLEEEFRGSLHRLAGVWITGQPMVGGETPHRAKTLVDRRARWVCIAVAVPAAVRPLPLEQALDEPGGLALVGPVQRDGRREGVPVPHCMGTWAAGDDRRVSRALHSAQPAQDCSQLVMRSGLVRRNPELDQRGQPPEGALPLGVHMLMARGQQRAGDRPVRKGCARRDHIRSVGSLAENVGEREAAHGWLSACEQPLDTRIVARDRHR